MWSSFLILGVNGHNSNPCIATAKIQGLRSIQIFVYLLLLWHVFFFWHYILMPLMASYSEQPQLFCMSSRAFTVANQNSSHSEKRHWSVFILQSATIIILCYLPGGKLDALGSPVYYIRSFTVHTAIHFLMLSTHLYLCRPHCFFPSTFPSDFYFCILSFHGQNISIL